jgi:DNA-binding response OmpR family regulator
VSIARTVLIVDDDTQVREALRRIFTSAGSDCRVAANGREGLEMFHASNPVLIMTDIMMPAMSGLELLERVRAANTDTAVIVLTGTPTVQTAIDSLRLGADDYLTKPADPDELLSAATRAVKQRQLRVGRREYHALLERVEASPAMAFLHAHGLDVEPKSLPADLMAAIADAKALYRAKAGQEGLTAEEVEVARSGGLDPEPNRGADPLAQGVAAYARLIRTGLTAKQAAARLGVSDARIRQRLQARTLLAVREGRVWKLPLFQFTKRGELPGWAEVCPSLPAAASPVAVERWLALPHPDLVTGDSETPTTPRAWLTEGRPPRAVAALAGELA